jgi:hypothetical protein
MNHFGSTQERIVFSAILFFAVAGFIGSLFHLFRLIF